MMTHRRPPSDRRLLTRIAHEACDGLKPHAGARALEQAVKRCCPRTWLADPTLEQAIALAVSSVKLRRAGR